ncbi:ABC transporter permease [Aquincola sp. MAHUQ-54]|uniref:ABC transporter permease n=1 Tax=Aquincola agrisoli TaxID=3119538 RepID=A0AAW9QG39_9BURK
MQAAQLIDGGFVRHAPHEAADPDESSNAGATLSALPIVHAAPRPGATPPAPGRGGAGRWLATRLPGLLLGLVSIGAVLLAWHLATTFKLDFYVRFGNIPTPADVLAKAIEVGQSGRFGMNVLISLRRILIGFALATVAGVALGLLIGRYRLVRRLSLPALEVLRPIPAIAWVPISVMLWPDNESSIVFITFLGAFFPILLNTVHGVQSLDPVLLRAARSLGAREGAVLAHVVLPGALPHVFTGLAVGMGVAWVSLIAAEMISGQFGIGYATWEAYSLIAYPEIVLGMVVIGLLGLLCSALINLAGRALMPWHVRSAQGGRA